MGNQIRTTILLSVMTALILWVGQLLGGRLGMIFALIFAAGINFLVTFKSVGTDRFQPEKFEC